MSDIVDRLNRARDSLGLRADAQFEITLLRAHKAERDAEIARLRADVDRLAASGEEAHQLYLKMSAKRDGWQWQPIETAPRYTRVIVTSTSSQGWIDFASCVLGEWRIDKGTAGNRVPHEPSHWIPLPEWPMLAHAASKTEEVK